MAKTLLGDISRHTCLRLRSTLDALRNTLIIALLTYTLTYLRITWCCAGDDARPDDYSFSLTSLRADDLVVDAVIRFRLSLQLPEVGAHNAIVHVIYRVGNATTPRRVRPIVRRDPLPAQLCLNIRVVDAVVRLQRGTDRHLTVFVGLSATVRLRRSEDGPSDTVRRQQRPRRRRIHKRAVRAIGISVLRQPLDETGPFITLTKSTCHSGESSAQNGGNGVNLWETATAQFLP